MEIKVISSKDEITSLTHNELMIQLTFNATHADILAIVAKCPDLRVLHVPHLYEKTISKSTETFLEIKGIVILECDADGHRRATLAERMASQEPDFD